MKKLTCHCEGLEIQVRLPDTGFEKLMRCNCSLCKRRGYIMTPVIPENFKNEVENELKFKLEEIIAKLDLVSREEFEVQKKLYEKLKNEVEIIKKNRKRKKIKKAK